MVVYFSNERGIKFKLGSHYDGFDGDRSSLFQCGGHDFVWMEEMYRLMADIFCR